MSRVHYDLRNKTVLITGGAGGIGSETARQLVAKGAQVALLDVNEGKLEQVAKQLGNRAWAQRADVTSQADLESSVAGTVERFGGIDVVVANAATFALGRIESLDPEVFDHVVEVAFLGVVRTVRAALPHVIAAHGFVSHISSGGGVIQSPFNAPYSASKAAVQAFANTLRLEVEDRGVGVGIVYFGLIATQPGLASIRDPIIGPIIEAMPQRLVKPRPVAEAARAIIRGIEERRRVVVYPRMFAPPVRISDFFQRLSEAQLRRATRKAHRPERG
jgi:NAD(P)-dependent dehydrogenase (short-subunit alcohol dehydrogenase family)